MKLRPDLAEIGGVLGEYGKAVSGLGWLPVIGQAVETTRVIAEALAKILQHRNEGVAGRRGEVKEALETRKADCGCAR